MSIATQNNESKMELIRRTEQALEQIRPYLQKDEGDILLLDITDDMTARVQFLGACSDCTINYQTFYFGVETKIRNYVPEIQKVELINQNGELILENHSTL